MTTLKKHEYLTIFAVVLLILALVIPMSAEAARATPVTVENLPEIMTMQDADNPVFQPFQHYSYDFIEIAHANTSLATGESADPVPAGKRLVVQHVSFSISSDAPFRHAALCSVRIWDPIRSTVVIEHPVPMIRQPLWDGEIARFSIPMTVYVDAEMEVGVNCGVNVDDDVREKIGITGYLVDIE